MLVGRTQKAKILGWIMRTILLYGYLMIWIIYAFILPFHAAFSSILFYLPPYFSNSFECKAGWRITHILSWAYSRFSGFSFGFIDQVSFFPLAHLFEVCGGSYMLIEWETLITISCLQNWRDEKEHNERLLHWVAWKDNQNFKISVVFHKNIYLVGWRSR